MNPRRLVAISPGKEFRVKSEMRQVNNYHRTHQIDHLESMMLLECNLGQIRKNQPYKAVMIAL